MATELLFSELKAWLDAQPENTASTPYEIIIKNAPSRGYTDAITRYVSIADMEMAAGVTVIAQEAFLGCTKLKIIKLPGNVASIGERAFQGCSNLTDVGLLEGVTSIGYGAFAGCKSLKSINTPASVTTIGGFAFSNCSSLNYFNLTYLTSIGTRAFSYCESLSTVYVYTPFSESLMQSDSFTGTPSNLRLLVSPPVLSGWQSVTLTNYGFASGAKVDSLYTKWVRVA